MGYWNLLVLAVSLSQPQAVIPPEPAAIVQANVVASREVGQVDIGTPLTMSSFVVTCDLGR